MDGVDAPPLNPDVIRHHGHACRLLSGRVARIEKDELKGTKYIIEGLAVDQQTSVGVIGRFTDTGRYLIITVYERETTMRNEFTAIVEQDEGWFIAYSPEIPGANGQGRTKQEALQSLKQAIALILEDRREDGLRGVPEGALRETVVVE